MLYTSLLKLHILLIAVPGLYGGVGIDAMHHPLIAHVAYLTQQSRAYNIGQRAGASGQSSFRSYAPAEVASRDTTVSISSAAQDPDASSSLFGSPSSIIGSSLAPRAP